jgi:HMG (high mobility group) box
MYSLPFTLACSLILVVSVVLREDPSLSLGEVAKELGVRWNLLEDSDKAVYVERARDEAARHKVEVCLHVHVHCRCTSTFPMISIETYTALHLSPSDI